MKWLFRITIFVLILFVGIVNAQSKRALIVAVGKYPQGQRYWKNLASERDLWYIKKALLYNGFSAANIDTLINEKATKANIIQALDKLAASCKLGDVVYFHFSGHGQQIQDDATDGFLDEADGYDEALIPYDAKGRWDNVDYQGQKHFRDDLLGEKLHKIREKVGKNGSVVAVIDACHSGTITRSAAVARGVPEPCKSLNYKPSGNIDLTKAPETGFLQNNSGNLGSLIVFSGSSPNQVNKETTDEEGKRVGALSYAFAKSISNLPSQANYRLLFEKIKAIIQADEPAQIPMIEGDASLKVFANEYVPLREIIAVNQKFNNAQYGFNDSAFVIARGNYNNILPGTILNILEYGTSNKVGTAIVKESTAFQSICILQKPAKLNTKIIYEAKIEALSYGAVTASYTIQNKAGNRNLLNQLTHYFKPFSFLQPSTQPDFTISIDKQADKFLVNVLEKNDSIRFASSELKSTDSLTTNELSAIVDNMKRGMRIRYLRKMQDGGGLMDKVNIKIVPDKVLSDSNELVLYPNEDFTLELSSNYEGVLYYTILDLLPDNDVKVLVPDTARDAGDADYSIRKGETKKIKMGTDETSITGKEFLKVIFSPYPIDLRPSFQLELVRTRSGKPLKPLEKLMDDLFPKDKNVLTRSMPVQMDDIAIVTTGFTLLKR